MLSCNVSVSPWSFSFFPASHCDLLLGPCREDDHGEAFLTPKSEERGTFFQTAHAGEVCNWGGKN